MMLFRKIFVFVVALQNIRLFLKQASEITPQGQGGFCVMNVATFRAIITAEIAKPG